jgi:PEP-CTERM motif
MKLRLITAALASTATLLAASAHAAGAGPLPVTCGSSLDTTFSVGYASACQGPLVGTLGAGAVDTATFGSQLFTLAGTTTDASGRFTANPGSVQWGELFLAAPQTGLFVLGLQGGGTYSLYLFDGGSTGLGSIEFDTRGITQGFAGLAGPSLTQAALFTSAVPEPGTYGFMLSGLLGLGLLAHRRRVAETRR